MSSGLTRTIELLSGTSTRLLQPKGPEHLLDALVGGQAKVLLGEDGVLLIQRDHADLEVKPGGPDEGDHPLEGGSDPSRLDPSDGGLTQSHASRELLLRHPGSATCLSNELASLHAASI